LRRIVFQFTGFDPAKPDVLHARFVREMGRFQRTWNVAAEASSPVSDRNEVVVSLVMV
jgi:hypothetical protein